MGNNQENDGYGISVFKSGTPSGEKTRGIIFFIIFCLIILIQAFYWLFANSVKPFVLDYFLPDHPDSGLLLAVC